MRRRLSNLLAICSLTLGLTLFSFKRAHAYIDAGTGSFLLQALLGGLFVTLFTAKFWWGRVTGLARRLWARGSLPARPDDDE